MNLKAKAYEGMVVDYLTAVDLYYEGKADYPKDKHDIVRLSPSLDALLTNYGRCDYSVAGYWTSSAGAVFKMLRPLSGGGVAVFKRSTNTGDYILLLNNVNLVDIFLQIPAIGETIINKLLWYNLDIEVKQEAANKSKQWSPDDYYLGAPKSELDELHKVTMSMAESCVMARNVDWEKF